MDTFSVLKLYSFSKEALLDVEEWWNSQIMYHLVKVTVTEVLESEQYL